MFAFVRENACELLPDCAEFYNSGAKIFTIIATEKKNQTEKEEDNVWTPEKKAELRKKMPKRLNKLGEWLFSEAGGKEYIVIIDEDAVLE